MLQTQILSPPYSCRCKKKHIHLQCVFHSIRFKVNKGWSTAVLLFLYPYVSSPTLPAKKTMSQHNQANACFCA
ncbi:hypothetical protein DW156_06805 [Bacteroides uniformis]|uniref:Uncharacterized protein n=1 Tax=Bacteroides uniformis TaxID=820 RepID=A0A413XE67_BACUN|nr:hypothetical protein DXB48_03025 [Bacteroides uniformis]RHB75662.1 hypothetical protein DW873_05870 [Bacteroides uniformis]RHI76546.1 hypothetical protein DW156_06805 [Bacteroides uniformis]